MLRICQLNIIEQHSTFQQCEFRYVIQHLIIMLFLKWMHHRLFPITHTILFKQFRHLERLQLQVNGLHRSEWLSQYFPCNLKWLIRVEIYDHQVQHVQLSSELRILPNEQLIFLLFLKEVIMIPRVIILIIKGVEESFRQP